MSNLPAPVPKSPAPITGPALGSYEHRVFATLNRKTMTVTGILDSQHFTRKKDQNFDVENIHRLALEYQATGAETTFELLKGLVNPTAHSLSRVEEMGILERDTQGNYYLMGTSVPIPRVLILKIIEFYREGHPIDALVNFWSLCLLNPDKRSRDHFFDYCERYGVVITTRGYALLYKAVTTKDKEGLPSEGVDLASFVSGEQVNIKKKKKALKHFEVYSGVDEEGSPYYRATRYAQGEGEKHVGNMEDLYKQLQEGKLKQTTLYTDKHTEKMDIVLGKPVKQDRSKCNPDPRVGCSHGLHVGSYAYVKGSFTRAGDTILTCLVNPKDVVAIPFESNQSKMRVCEYFPIGRMEISEEGNWKELEGGYFEDDFATFEDSEVRTLASKIEDDPMWKQQTKEEKEEAKTAASFRLRTAALLDTTES